MHELSPREERSRAAFGSKDTLDIYSVVSGYSADPPDTFSATDVRDQFFDPRAVKLAVVRKRLAVLEEVGEIEQVPSEDRDTLYQRIDDDSPFWAWIRELADQEIERSLQE